MDDRNRGEKGFYATQMIFFNLKRNFIKTIVKSTMFYRIKNQRENENKV